MNYPSTFQAINDIGYHQLFRKTSFISIPALSHKLFRFKKTFSLFNPMKQFLPMWF